MKFFRMDSDVWNWPVWDRLWDEIGRADFHVAKALWLDLYALVCSELKSSDQQSVTISLSTLKKSSRISRQKLDFCLTKLQQTLEFRLTIVGRDSEGIPTKVEIFYPNLLKKQKLKSRDGDGKFTPDGAPNLGPDLDIDLDIDLDSPLSPPFAGGESCGKQPGPKSARQRNRELRDTATALATKAIGACRQCLDPFACAEVIGELGVRMLAIKFGSVDVFYRAYSRAVADSNASNFEAQLRNSIQALLPEVRSAMTAQASDEEAPSNLGGLP